MIRKFDYSKIAPYLDLRPPYNGPLIHRCLERAGIKPQMMACDIGAGTGRLTLILLHYGLGVAAIDPDPSMAEMGIKKTRHFPAAIWTNESAERSGQPSGRFDLVTYGSSFHLVDRRKALKESARILRPGGWFFCLWNYRNLGNELQAGIENLIHCAIPDYQYGIRRQDQTETILKCSHFEEVWRFEGTCIHRMNNLLIVDAWRSHLNLLIQSGNHFESILERIKELLESTGKNEQDIPYRTSVWMARRKL